MDVYIPKTSCLCHFYKSIEMSVVTVHTAVGYKVYRDYVAATGDQTPTLIASTEVSEDDVYNLLKAMFDNKDDLVAGHAKFEFLNLEDAVAGISVPFHPGAVKYFAEQGIEVE